MPNESDIVLLLRSEGIDIVGTIVADLSRTDHFYAFINVVRDRNNLQIPTNVELRRIKDNLASRGVVVEFVLLDSKERDEDAAIRATLLHNFPDSIRNSFASVDGKKATVWIDPKRDVDEVEDNSIRIILESLLNLIGLNLVGVEYTNRNNVPSVLACLRAVRLLSPVDVPTLTEKLGSQGFVISSGRWISSRLDSLRKTGQIVRLKSGLYVMAFEGLRALGSGKSNRSPDISRLLALARRRR